jgi:hypothetical protein
MRDKHMDRSPEEIAEGIVTRWLMQAVVPGDTAGEVGDYLATVYTRVLQAVKAGVSTPEKTLLETWERK